VETAGVDRTGCGDPDTRRDIDAECVRGDELRAARADFLGEPERTGKSAAARVHDRTGMRVVVIEAVREDTVQQHRVAQRQPDRHADHGVSAGLACGAQARERAMREVELRCGEGGSDHVEHVQLRMLDHVRGHCVRARRERGDCLGDTHPLIL
jgi:hypothetical protein